MKLKYKSVITEGMKRGLEYLDVMLDAYFGYF